MPIDPEFMNKLKQHGEHESHSVWGEVKPPEKLGIHGTTVAVDHDLCDGDEVCVGVRPVNVFEMIESKDHPTSEKKSDPARESECIFCMACEGQCSPQAIKITQQ